jgi:hypothetical protein
MTTAATTNAAPGTTAAPAATDAGGAVSRQVARNESAGAPQPPPRISGPAATIPSAPRSTTAAPSGADYTFLDEEAPAEDGREAGERLADTYRNRQGGSPSGGFGSNRRFNVRERSPSRLAPVERPAVATIRHLIDRMEAFHRRQGRYAGLAELRAAGLALDVPVSGNSFERRGFRFEVSVESDGFRVTATPLVPSGRSFVGDDSGYIRVGMD